MKTAVLVDCTHVCIVLEMPASTAGYVLHDHGCGLYVL